MSITWRSASRCAESRGVRSAQAQSAAVCVGRVNAPRSRQTQRYAEANAAAGGAQYRCRRRDGAYRECKSADQNVMAHRRVSAQECTSRQAG